MQPRCRQEAQAAHAMTPLGLLKKVMSLRSKWSKNKDQAFPKNTLHHGKSEATMHNEAKSNMLSHKAIRP